ncbi:MAG TPA: hypothetical protein PK210_05025 [Bacteroidia bacterium]|nr:hypothetical protein [Bacteroidia bacterium]
MSAKKKIVKEDEVVLPEYVLLLKGLRKHVMQKRHYESDKERIHKAGYKLATTEQCAKHFGIEFNEPDKKQIESVKSEEKQEEIEE